jgi:alanine racemase
LKNNKIDIKYIHACNSAAILNFPEAHYNMVRPGIMIYGYYPSEELIDSVQLKPSMVLKSQIVFLKEVPENTSISYNRTFITKRPSKIATVPIGYADGFRRSLSNNGFVAVKNQRVPIVGTVCMDMFMIDVTEIPDVRIGDEVRIFDNDLVTVDEIAKRCNTINYEIIATLGTRIPRIYEEK